LLKKLHDYLLEGLPVSSEVEYLLAPNRAHTHTHTLKVISMSRLPSSIPLDKDHILAGDGTSFVAASDTKSPIFIKCTSRDIQIILLPSPMLGLLRQW
jgi:hypothetical protein